MIGRGMANIIVRFARHRDDMRLANFQRVRGLDAEWKLLRCPTEYCLPNLTPCWGQPESRRQPFRGCFRWHPQARCECRRLLPLFSSKNTSTSYSYGVNGARLKKTRSLTVP